MKKNIKKPLSSVYVMIQNIPISLPETANFVCQDSRGCWFYCTRRPRITEEPDWAPKKIPIQVVNSDGKMLSRVLQTRISKKWQDTLEVTIRR